jgi:hypothetical protein
MGALDLLSMLSLRGVRIGHPTGGVPQIVPLDVAAAVGMAHLEDHQTQLIFGKYLDDLNSRNQFFGYWLANRLDHAKASGWKWERGDIYRLAKYSLAEHMGHNRCPECEGVGSILAGQKKIVCHLCSGVGILYYSERQMAHYFKITRHAYRQTWLARVAESRKQLQAWEQQAGDAIARTIDMRNQKS